MLALKLVLAPFAVVAAVVLAMIVHISTLTLHHRLSWTSASGTVLHAEALCEVTYQPADAVLRAVAGRTACDRTDEIILPPGGSTPRTFKGEYGSVTYSVGGAERIWDGKLSDAGIYNASPGQTVAIYYDPASPGSIDTAQAKGWLGGLLISGTAGGFVAFYAWLLWPRRKNPPGPTNRPTPPAARIASTRRRQGFGKA